MKVTMKGRGGDVASTKVELCFDVASVRKRSTPFGVTLAYPGLKPAGELGGPELSTRVVRVALPAGAGDVRVHCETRGGKRVVERVTELAASQHARPGAKIAARIERAKADVSANGSIEALGMRFPAVPARALEPPRRELYEKLVKTPPALARLVAVEEVGLNPVAVVAVTPFRVTKDASIEIVELVELVVEWRVRDIARPPAPERFPRWDEVELERARLINPEIVIDPTRFLPRLLGPVEYLIITDNRRWNAATITAGDATDGNLVSEFERLARWKRKRGLSARVVTIGEIVGGRFGAFRGGSRDLQEVIRKFVKWARASWGTQWLLLGGDVEIVPPRMATSALFNIMDIVTDDPPPGGKGIWRGTFAVFDVTGVGGVAAGQPLVVVDSGITVPFDATGASSTTQRGWYFVTDATGATRSTAPTMWIRVNGPAAEVNRRIHSITFESTIPTDFYYSSLVGPGYSQPGRHDWDLLDNGLYAQNIDTTDLDGISYRADVSVGRAPASNARDAAAFVDKVIRYERYRAGDGSALDEAWRSRTTVVSANWGGRLWFESWAATPPPNGRYFHDTAGASTLLTIDTAFTSMNWQLLSLVTETDIRSIPYNSTASSTLRGWYFAISATDHRPSENVTIVLGVQQRTPVPTRWVVVRGAADELAPRWFVFDWSDPDGSMADQETLRVQIQRDVPGILRSFARLYEDEIDLDAVAQAAGPFQHLTQPRLRDELNAGTHFVSMSGHGWWGGCCGMDPTLANGLANGKTFIAYADSCFTSEYDHTPEDAVSETLVCRENSGAVGYVGNSRYSWIGIGDDFQRAFFAAMPTTNRLGRLLDTKATLVNAVPHWHQMYYRWTIMALNLMGDPEMPLWLDGPRYLTIDAPERTWRRLTIRVTTRNVRLGGDGRIRFVDVPVAGAAVTAANGADVIVGHTDADGYATLDVHAMAGADAEVTVWKDGYVPAERTVAILTDLWIRPHRIIGVTWLGPVREVMVETESGRRAFALPDGTAGSHIAAALERAATTGDQPHLAVSPTRELLLGVHVGKSTPPALDDTVLEMLDATRVRVVESIAEAPHVEHAITVHAPPAYVVPAIHAAEPTNGAPAVVPAIAAPETIERTAAD